MVYFKMDAFFNHIRKHADKTVFIEDEKSYTFDQFIHDVEALTSEIKSSINTSTILFSWNYESTYLNIVRLFAYAKCNGIIFPSNLKNRIAPNLSPSTIQTNDGSILVYPAPINEFTATLQSKKCPGLIIATSGTGNQPKLTVIDFGLLCSKYLKLQTSYHSTLIFSLEHISGIETLLSIVTPGGCMVLDKSRTIVSLTEAIKKNKSTLLACTPSFLVQTLLQNRLNNEYFSSVQKINCGGELLSGFWMHKFQEALPNVSINQAFGTTESTNIRTFTASNDRSKFMPGKLNEDYLVKDNLLFLKNRNYNLGNWEENKINKEEWIETTDIVSVDEEGFLSVVGRSDAAIMVGGNKVNPIEVEKIIEVIPGVDFVKIYGESNLLLGQVVVAEIVTQSADLNAMKSIMFKHCRQVLPDYKIPVKIIFTKNMEVTLRFKNTTKRSE